MLNLDYDIKNIDQVSHKILNSILEHKEQNKNLSRAVVVGFDGSMGAGKTTFISSLCSHLCVTDSVSSPTFVILNEYNILNNVINHDEHNNCQKDLFEKVIHIDAYRIDDAFDQELLHLSDYLANPDNLIFIEWYQNLKNISLDFLINITMFTSDKDQSINIDQKRHLSIIKF